MPTVANASTMVDGIDDVVVARSGRGDVGGKRFGCRRGGVEEDVHLGRVRDLARRDERELVEQALGILHNADDCLAALGPGVADPQVELRGQPGRERDLIGPGRIVPGEQLQHRPAVGALRVLGTELIRLRRARDAEGLVGDDLHRAEATRQQCGLGRHVRRAVRRRLARRRQVEGRQILGRAEPGVGGRRRVDRNRGADDDGRHRDDDEQQNEQLLAPLAPEEAPGPAQHGPAGRDTAAARCRSRARDGPLEDVDAHWCGTSASNASGPSSGSVWSTTRPSRRKTTRSAHEASCASWVTTTAAKPR